MVKRKILVVFGTRPEAVKLCPVVQALRREPAFETRVCVTAQHREMLDQVLEVFGVRPDRDLNLMTQRQTLSELTARVLTSMEPVLGVEKPDLVLVQGDTTTTFATALACFYAGIAVGHVEAGLRTGDLKRPFPEEWNRVATSRVTTWHFAPTARSRENLLREGTAEASILVAGNTVIDALLDVVGRSEPSIPGLPDVSGRSLLVVEAHRRESFGEPMRRICRAIRRIAESRGNVHVAFPVHRNPEVSGPVNEILSGLPNVSLLTPQEYVAFAHLMKRARLVVTDSGGIQEEAPSLGVPVLVLREVTERPEAVEAGTVKIVGVDEDRIVAEATRLLTDDAAHAAMARAVNPYGDGRASERIVDFLRWAWGMRASPPAPFQPSQ